MAVNFTRIPVSSWGKEAIDQAGKLDWADLVDFPAELNGRITPSFYMKFVREIFYPVVAIVLRNDVDTIRDIQANGFDCYCPTNDEDNIFERLEVIA